MGRIYIGSPGNAGSSPRMNRNIRRSCIVSACALILAVLTSPVFGAQNTSGAKPSGGTLQGAVTHADEQGQLSVVQGIQLKLTPESGSPVLTAVTDEQGHYSFTGLSAGNYTLEATLEGFQTYKEVVKLAADESLIHDLKMKISSVTQSVDVNGEAETISTQNANSTATITARESTDVPLAEQKFEEALPLVPGVVRASNGTLNMKGTAESQGMLLVDSAETVDPVTGSFSIPIPLGAIDTLSVSNTPYGA